MVSLRSGRQLTGTAMADGQQANNEVHSQTSSSRRATRGTMDALQAIHDTQNEILNAIHTLTETILAQATQKPENQTQAPNTNAGNPLQNPPTPLVQPNPPPQATPTIPPLPIGTPLTNHTIVGSATTRPKTEPTTSQPNPNLLCHCR